MIEIMGQTDLPIDKVEELTHSINTNAPYVYNLYVKYGNLYGINPIVAYCQAIDETGWFKSYEKQGNFCGLGVITTGQQGVIVNTDDEKVLLHIQHLYGYATDLPLKTECIDPRYKYTPHNCKYLTDLNNKWAMNNHYGEDIENIINKFYEYCNKDINNNSNTNNQGDGHKMKFAIDPGHGDVNGSLNGDGGAVGYLNEQNCALDVANSVISKLQALGHEAYNVRPSSASSVTNSLQQRCDSANGADYLISIHLNASNGQGHGTEVYAMSEAGQELAKRIVDNLANLGWSNRGVKNGSNLYVIRHSNPVAVLCEICFVDNQDDANLFNNLGINTIANAIVKGITGQTIDIPSNAPTSTETSTNTQPSLNNEDILKQQIMALQYNLNSEYNAKLDVDGVVGKLTLSALQGIENLLVKGHKSYVVLWIQEKLQNWGYLKPNSYTSMVLDSTSIGAITELQKNWGRETSGKMSLSTWSIFLNNK